MLWFFLYSKLYFSFEAKYLSCFSKRKKWSKCFKIKLTESTSRSSKSWEKSIPRFGLGIVDQFEWWFVFVMEIRVLIVCLRSKLRLVLIDIFSVRICCAGPVRNLDFYERLRIKHFFGGFTFPKRSDFEKGWYGMSLNFSGSWHGPQPVGLSWITGEMNSAITGTNYDLNRKICRFLIRFRYGSSRSTVSYQTVRHSCQRNLKLNLDSWAGNEDITGPYPFLSMFSISSR